MLYLPNANNSFEHISQHWTENKAPFSISTYEGDYFAI